jgi:pyruvate/2-oxoacid:ferredoxin oxidoreductase alpha subunit
MDEQAPETSRLYRPPMSAGYGYPAAETKKSSAWKWVLIVLFCFLLLGGGVGAMVISAIRAKQRAERVLVPAMEELHAQIREEVEREIERARQEQERAMEESRRAAEEAGANAPPPPLAPPQPGELPSGLEEYKYPNAEVSESASVVGNEFVKMLTDDSVGKVKEYYKKQLGEPLFKGKGENGESVIFQIPGSPSIIITINADDENAEKTQINVIRSRFQLPGLKS